MAFFLAPDRRLDGAADVVVGNARADQVSQRRFPKREQARAQAALGSEPDPVAGRAERLAHRGDEADAARRAVRELESRRGSWTRIDNRLQREQVLDLFLDMKTRDYLLVGPDVVAVQRHELDEADLVALVAREPREVDDLIVVLALHDHHVQLDRPKPGFA